jgi:hypothetical protein
VHAELFAGVYGPLLVVPRPGLSEFLSRASRVAELVIFTAAAPGKYPYRRRMACARGICCDRPCILHQHTFICCAGYAHPILDVLDPTGKLFAARLYRDATTATLHHSNVKVQFLCRCADAAVSTHTAEHLGLNQTPQLHLCMLCIA